MFFCQRGGSVFRAGKPQNNRSRRACSCGSRFSCRFRKAHSTPFSWAYSSFVEDCFERLHLDLAQCVDGRAIEFGKCGSDQRRFCLGQHLFHGVDEAVIDRWVHTSLIVSCNRVGMVSRKSTSGFFSRPLSTASTMGFPVSSYALTRVTKSECPLRSEISSTPKRPNCSGPPEMGDIIEPDHLAYRAATVSHQINLLDKNSCVKAGHVLWQGGHPGTPHTRTVVNVPTVTVPVGHATVMGL
jgi:hypothetical protein